MDKLQKKTLLFGLAGLVVYILFFVYVDRSVDTWIHKNWADAWIHTAGTYISFLANGPFFKILASNIFRLFANNACKSVKYTLVVGVSMKRIPFPIASTFLST